MSLKNSKNEMRKLNNLKFHGTNLECLLGLGRVVGFFPAGVGSSFLGREYVGVEYLSAAHNLDSPAVRAEYPIIQQLGHHQKY